MQSHQASVHAPGAGGSGHEWRRHEGSTGAANFLTSRKAADLRRHARESNRSPAEADARGRIISRWPSKREMTELRHAEMRMRCLLPGRRKRWRGVMIIIDGALLALLPYNFPKLFLSSFYRIMHDDKFVMNSALALSRALC